MNSAAGGSSNMDGSMLAHTTTQNQSTVLVKQENTGDKNHPYLCRGCNTQLSDMLILKAGDSFWHKECMRCQDCGLSLDQKCFIRDGMVLCSDDFFRRFGPICSGCNQNVHSSDIVRKIKSKVYHLDCLCCMNCKKKLDTGDHFYMLDDGRIICKDEYMEKSKQAPDNNSQEKTKRARTFINTNQLTRLKHAYYNMPKPTLIERQRIAKEIGLDMRVVQVWFQNRRAKDRRNVNKPLHPLLQAGRRSKHSRSKTWSAGMLRGTEMDKDEDIEDDSSDYSDMYQSREDLCNPSQSHLYRSKQYLPDDFQTVSPSSFNEEHFDFEAQSYSSTPINNVRTMTSGAPHLLRGMDNNMPNLSSRIDGFSNDSRMFGHNYNSNFPYWNGGSMNIRFSTSGSYDTMPTMTSQYFQPADQRNSVSNGLQYHNSF